MWFSHFLKKQKNHSHLASGNINKAHRGMGQSLTVVSPLTPSDGNDSFLFCFFSPRPWLMWWLAWWIAGQRAANTWDCLPFIFRTEVFWIQSEMSSQSQAASCPLFSSSYNNQCFLWQDFFFFNPPMVCSGYPRKQIMFIWKLFWWLTCFTIKLLLVQFRPKTKMSSLFIMKRIWHKTIWIKLAELL